MYTKLHRIKSALRESVEIAEKVQNPILYLGSEANAAFIAHARTMTPLACKALLTAIEGLEQTLIGIGNTDNHMSYENAFIVNSIGDLVEKALSSITSTWPDA